jgi:hypothetical protein
MATIPPELRAEAAAALAYASRKGFSGGFLPVLLAVPFGFDSLDIWAWLEPRAHGTLNQRRHEAARRMCDLPDDERIVIAGWRWHKISSAQIVPELPLPLAIEFCEFLSGSSLPTNSRTTAEDLEAWLEFFNSPMHLDDDVKSAGATPEQIATMLKGK